MNKLVNIVIAAAFISLISWAVFDIHWWVTPLPVSRGAVLTLLHIIPLAIGFINLMSWLIDKSGLE